MGAADAAPSGSTSPDESPLAATRRRRQSFALLSGVTQVDDGGVRQLERIAVLEHGSSRCSRQSEAGAGEKLAGWGQDTPGASGRACETPLRPSFLAAFHPSSRSAASPDLPGAPQLADQRPLRPARLTPLCLRAVVTLATLLQPTPRALPANARLGWPIFGASRRLAGWTGREQTAWSCERWADSAVA